MKLYHCDAGDMREAVYEDITVNAGHWEYFRAVNLIAAPSRGAARNIMRREYDVEFTYPMTIRYIDSVDVEQGIVTDDYLHLYANCVLNGSETYEWDFWMGVGDLGYYHE